MLFNVNLIKIQFSASVKYENEALYEFGIIKEAHFYKTNSNINIKRTYITNLIHNKIKRLWAVLVQNKPVDNHERSCIFF